VKFLLALFLSGCVSTDIKQELVAHCDFGILPVIQDVESSPYIIVMDGFIITVKCREILE
jgi:hypothetical protein